MSHIKVWYTEPKILLRNGSIDPRYERADCYYENDVKKIDWDMERLIVGRKTIFDYDYFDGEHEEDLYSDYCGHYYWEDLNEAWTEHIEELDQARYNDCHSIKKIIVDGKVVYLNPEFEDEFKEETPTMEANE